MKHNRFIYSIFFTAIFLGGLFFVSNAVHAGRGAELIQCGVPKDKDHVYSVWSMVGKYEKRACLQVEKGTQVVDYWELFKSEDLPFIIEC